MTGASGFAFRTLITGATGFIGRHLTQRLIEAGAIVGAGAFPGEDGEYARALPKPAILIPLDVQDPKSVQAAIAMFEPEVVFHLAAVGVSDPQIDPLTALDVNVEGTIHLLEAVRSRQVNRVVLVGTCYEYGARETVEGLDPFNFYAASKVASWAFARAYWRSLAFPLVTARLFQVYGPGQPGHTLVPSAIHAALAGEDFPMTVGEQERDFIYVEDVVEGMLAAATAPDIEGESLDLGTGVGHTVYEVVERIWAMTGARGRILRGALPSRPGEGMRLVADAERTARLTGWRATTGLEEGLRRTVEETRGRGEQNEQGKRG